MMTSWTGLEGIALGGEYELLQWLGESGPGGSFFLTAFGPERRKAVLKVVTGSATAGEEQLDLWRWIARLSHPHLLGLLDCGRDTAAGEPVLYAVFEYPDDSLATAVEQGALSEAETRDVLAAAAGALDYIHSQGLVHTAVDPQHVVAVGNTIKLASDTLRPPSREYTTAGDVQSLGALVYQLLTRRRLDPGRSPDLSSIQDPLRTIILHALDPNPSRRWTLRQIADALRPAPQKAAPPPRARVAEPPRPARVTEPPRSARAVEPEAAPDGAPAKWPFAAAAVVLLIFGLFWLLRKTPAPAPAPEAPVPAAAAVHPAAPPGPAAAPAPPAPGRNDWRVVVYTYARQPDAEKRAQSLARKWSAFHPEVFMPNGPGRGPYLVSIGGRMTRKEALRLQKQARAKGLPRDTFARNYER